MQYLQAELRTVNEALATKQQQAVQTLQENARLLSDLSRSRRPAHPREEVRSLRPLKDKLGFAQRRTEELGRRLVEQEAAIHQLNASNDQLQARLNDLTTAKQQLELALVAAKHPSRRKSRSWPACWSVSALRCPVLMRPRRTH